MNEKPDQQVERPRQKQHEDLAALWSVGVQVEARVYRNARTLKSIQRHIACVGKPTREK